MIEEEGISNWAEEIPLLASLKKTNCFSVPNNYFIDLSKNIINQIAIEELAGKDVTFQVPFNYFENSQSKIQETIFIEDRRNSLQSKNKGFITPHVYFETNKVEIIGKIELKKSPFRKIIRLNLIRYAAAACILLTTTFGIYLNIKRLNNINYQLSKITDDAIESYLKQTVESSDIPVIIENLENKPVFSLDENQLNADEMDSYLKTTL